MSPSITCTYKHALCMVNARDWMQWADDVCWMLMRFFGCFLEKKKKAAECFLCAFKAERKEMRERERERVVVVVVGGVWKTDIPTLFIKVEPRSHLLAGVCMYQINTPPWTYASLPFSYHITHCHYIFENCDVQKLQFAWPDSPPCLPEYTHVHRPALFPQRPSFFFTSVQTNEVKI